MKGLTLLKRSCSCISSQARRTGWLALASLGLVIVTGGVAGQAIAQTYTYARTGTNDLGLCSEGKGPSVLVAVRGLKSADGNLFVRAYPARKSDWLKSKRYVMRIDAAPRAGKMDVCVPLPAAGAYAIAVQHDANGNRSTDLSTDGAGMSNNPGFRKILGIPLPPSLERVQFNAGSGVTRMTIQIVYL
ncbi:MAG: DUF2141 domain-containing protein [Erythrobacteraceae bacterium]|jgi:uncharacterized protein (DUF2141 family)|nr:DUF2141 domain-containing protein [Erythrobacteraceae bacterium]